ncbi:MAG: hypothetical protein PHW34_05170 [Hespellia sp.]|nr:hypothetical protein [Hespellia sp.]
MQNRKVFIDWVRCPICGNTSVEGDPNRVWIEEDCTLAEYMDGDHYKTYMIYNNALRAIEKSIEPYSNENISLNTESN